jgi:hypothetical protein
MEVQRTLETRWRCNRSKIRNSWSCDTCTADGAGTRNETWFGSFRGLNLRVRIERTTTFSWRYHGIGTRTVDDCKSLVYVIGLYSSHHLDKLNSGWEPIYILLFPYITKLSSRWVTYWKSVFFPIPKIHTKLCKCHSKQAFLSCNRVR